MHLQTQKNPATLTDLRSSMIGLALLLAILFPVTAKAGVQMLTPGKVCKFTQTNGADIRIFTGYVTSSGPAQPYVFSGVNIGRTPHVVAVEEMLKGAALPSTITLHTLGGVSSSVNTIIPEVKPLGSSLYVFIVLVTGSGEYFPLGLGSGTITAAIQNSEVVVTDPDSPGLPAGTIVSASTFKCPMTGTVIGIEPQLKPFELQEF